MRRTTSAFAPWLLALAAPGAFAQSAPQPDRVEEDWEVVVGNPDPVGVGPQMSTSMSPVSDGSISCFVFDLNYRDYPSFLPGGMQVQVWDGETLVAAATKGSDRCATAGETI